MLRLLVGAACIAVIAVVGYYFYGEYQRHEADAAYATGVEAAQIEECRSVAADLYTVLQGGSLGRRFVQQEAKAQLRKCVAAGRLGVADVDEVGL